MKANLHRNIDLVRIPIKAGVTEYNFPRNVDWADKKIDKLVFFSALSTNGFPLLDPVTGMLPVYGDLYGNGKNIYINLTNSQGVEVVHYMHLYQISSTTDEAGVIEINDKLNLSLCSVKMTNAPVEDGVLIFYVFWGGKKVDNYDYPTRSVTIDFDLSANQELTFRELLNTYIHGSNMPDTKVKGLIAWDSVNNPAWLTLRDHNRSYIIKHLNTQMAYFPQVYPQVIEDYPVSPFGWINPQVLPMLFDNIDIDFDYSRIRNAHNEDGKQRLTFLF